MKLDIFRSVFGRIHNVEINPIGIRYLPIPKCTDRNFLVIAIHTSFNMQYSHTFFAFELRVKYITCTITLRW
uniref:Uncharacterized protein n=1 Tax=Anguilla anguilla TaxID=7936 RepID=A0A0E9WTH4_ANGAN